MSEVTTGKDAAMQDVKIGDLVAFVAPYTQVLEEGTIKKFTPQGITVESARGKKTNRKISQVIKLPNELRLERLLEI